MRIPLSILVFGLAAPSVGHAAPVDVTLRDYLVYRDYVASLEGGATLTLGEWSHNDASGSWIEVPRSINGRIDGPGTVTSAAFNGLSADPGWTTITVQGTYQTLELRGAEDDGANRGSAGPWGAWSSVSGSVVPAPLADAQYLSYRVTLGAGGVVTQVELTMGRQIQDAHPRLLVEDVAALQARCAGTLSHQCDMNTMFANSNHLSAAVATYNDSELARIAKVMAMQYLAAGQTVHADRVRAVLLELASRDRQYWVTLRDSIQDLGLGWIGLSWMLALDWAWDALATDPTSLQTIVDGTAVFIDYLLEMYKHSDFNNHFYLGRSPVLLAGLAMYGEGVRDADAARYVAAGFDFLFNHEHPALNVVAGDMGGWHESLGYFDGEMGYPVAVDMDALRTATGLDFFQSSSFWRTLPSWYLHSTVPWDGTLIHWADQGKQRWATAVDGSASEGKGTRSYLTGIAKNLRRLGYPEAELAQYLVDDAIGVYYDSGSFAESFYKVAHLNDIIWYEPGAAKAPLPDARASAHFENLGEIILREGNQTTDAMAMFACADFRGGHQQSDNGHFSIWYKGYLAVDSGFYDGWGSSHHMNYARRTIAHNTLTITMPGETFTNTSHNDGGQSVGCSTTYYNLPAEDSDCNECDMVLSTFTDPYFDFIGADLTASYDPAKVSLVTRELVWLRPNLFVVFDRVESTNASYAKRFLLHGAGAYVQAGTDWRVDHDQGRMFVRTLLPAGATVTQVGGAGSEWEIEGTNYPPSRGTAFAGTHRLEVAPASAMAFDNFLHVLEVADQTASAMTSATLVQSAGVVGTLVGDWLVLFGARGPMTGLSLEIDPGRATHVVVGDLQAAMAYDIQAGAASFTVISDANGVLFFEDDNSAQHIISVGEGACPDADADGYLDAACGGTDCDDTDPTLNPTRGCGGDGGTMGGDVGVAGLGDSLGDSRSPLLTGGCDCAGGDPLAWAAVLALAVVGLLLRRRPRRL